MTAGLTIFVLFFVNSAQAQWRFYLNPNDAAKIQEQQQKNFESGIDQVLNQVIDAGGNDLLTSETGQRISITALKNQIPSIQYRPSQNLFLTSQEDIECSNSLKAQWLTAKDSSTGHPIVSTTTANNLGKVDFKEWILLIHEAISALGMTDDEYQITGPLIALVMESQATHISIPSLILKSDRPDLRLLAEPLKHVKLREHAPVYQLKPDDLCYRFRTTATLGHPAAPLTIMPLVDANTTGGTTGIGGGGDSSALVFKINLLRGAAAWLQKNATSLNAQDREKFFAILNELGIEPLDDQRSLWTMTIPLQMELTKSERTGKLTAYFLIDRLEEAQALYFPRALIYKHVNEVMLPATSLRMRNRHTLYGSEMAERRGVPASQISSDEQKRYFVP